jgi:hypothetical protein
MATKTTRRTQTQIYLLPKSRSLCPSEGPVGAVGAGGLGGLGTGAGAGTGGMPLGRMGGRKVGTGPGTCTTVLFAILKRRMDDAVVILARVQLGWLDM